MRVAYLDESYTKENYWMVALLCNDATVARLVNDLDAVTRAAASFGVSPETELHGHELFHGKGQWAMMKGKTRALVGVYLKALEAIGQSGCDIIWLSWAATRPNS